MVTFHHQLSRTVYQTIVQRNAVSAIRCKSLITHLMVAKTDARRVQRTQKQARIEPNASAKILSYLMVRINAFVIKDIII